MEYLKYFEKPIGKFLENIGDEIKQVLYNKLKQHQYECFERSNKVKSILYRQPVEFKSVYQPLKIRLLNEQLEENELFAENCEILFQPGNKVIIQGNAGCGKSTFLRSLYIKACQLGNHLPILIDLRNFNHFDNTFQTFLFDYFLDHKLKETTKLIERLLNKGGIIFFLDGFDEISSEKKYELLEQINQVVIRFPKNSYIISSRPNSSIEQLPLFYNYNIAPLTINEIFEFINRQLIDSRLKDQLCTTLRNYVDTISFFEMLKNPLVLSLYIKSFEYYKIVELTDTEFFSNVFNSLIYDHDKTVKLGYVRSLSTKISKTSLKDFLEVFSYKMLSENKFDFIESELYREIDIINGKMHFFNCDTNEFVSDLFESLGIIYKDGIYFSLPHKAFQEYFAANFISNLESTDFKLKVYQQIISNDILRYNFNFLKYLRQTDEIAFHIQLTIFFIDDLISINIHPDYEIYLDRLDNTQDIFERRELMTTVGSDAWRLFSSFFEKCLIVYQFDEFSQSYDIEITDFSMNSYQKMLNYLFYNFIIQKQILTNWIGFSFNCDKETFNSIVNVTYTDNKTESTHYFETGEGLIDFSNNEVLALLRNVGFHSLLYKIISEIKEYLAVIKNSIEQHNSRESLFN